MSEPDANGWMPIESAPKDGSEIILAWSANFDGTAKWFQTIGCWEAQFDPIFDYDDGTSGGYRGAWTDYTVSSWVYEQYAEIYPSRWQPLPKPPVETQPNDHTR